VIRHFNRSQARADRSDSAANGCCNLGVHYCSRMAQVQDGLNQTQGFALISETTAARNLLGYGLWALRNARFWETTRDPILTMLSIGVEKMLKMSLGLAHVAEHGEWPPLATFRDVWRHDIGNMHDALLRTIRGRLSEATHRAYVESKLVEVENDPALPLLMAALSRYGQTGRFYHLDELALSPQSGEDPGHMWSEAENVALRLDRAMKARFDAASSNPDPDAFDAFVHELEARLAESIERWWDIIALAGKHGILGERGGGWGHDVDRSMVGRQIRED